MNVDLPAWLTTERLLALLSAFAVLVIGLALARAASWFTRRALTPRFGPQVALITQRVISGLVTGLAVVAALRAVGVDLSVLLGAAGVLTVAVGFASQTAASNLISGLFLMVERPFAVGDAIQIGSTTGEVVAVDVLSVKLRTFDNLLVRVPNEVILKAEIRNLTAFPIRRVDIPLTLVHDVDVDAARGLLARAAEGHPLCLDEPRPQTLVLGLTLDGIQVQVNAWASTPNFLALKNELPGRLLRALAEGGMSLAVPRRHLTRGEP